MLLEIALNAVSVVLEGAGDVHLTVATGRRHATRSRPHVGPFYGASLYSCSLFIRRSTCGSYRIVSYRIAIFCLISYRIYRFLLWLYRAITKTISHEPTSRLMECCLFDEQRMSRTMSANGKAMSLN